jgi:nucleoid-associated protein YgaU
MRRPGALAVAVLIAALSSPLPAAAWIHVARAGETLEQLAGRYYGRPELSMMIRAANGFVHPDDGRLIEGERVEIPEVTYHRVSSGESWSSIAERYLGSARRGKFLAELNGEAADTILVAGKIVKIPYQLLYILAPDESLRSIARAYLGGKRNSDWLKAYNIKRKKKYGRGDALLVPVVGVEFTDEEQRRITAERDVRFTGEDQQAQARAVAQITALREAYATGRYVQMVAAGQRLLHAGKLTVPQQIGVHKFLGFAYVALGVRDLAVGAFIAAIELQPDMELSPITTSPKILAVFREAREKAAKDNSRKDKSSGAMGKSGG